MDACIPVYQKYVLTIEEAAAYFHIGKGKLRRMIAQDEDASYLLHNGNRVQIKRRLFEEFIDRCKVI